MSDFKFACPLCDQHIQCDTRMGGQQIKCPACQGDIQIPGAPTTVLLTPSPSAAPAAPAPAPQPVRPSLRVTAHPPAASTAPSAPRPAPPPPPPPRAMPSALLQDPVDAPGAKRKRILQWAAAIVILPIALYFGFKGVQSLQHKFNVASQKAAEDEKDSGMSGQVGHIGELYSMLDATDPEKMGRFPKNDSRNNPNARRAGKYTEMAQAAAANLKSFESQPVVPAAWTLNANEARIPDCKVNGSVHGADFLAAGVRIDRAAQYSVLTFWHGTNRAPEREVIAFLPVKEDEKLDGRSWMISADSSNVVVQIMKRWRPDPRYAPKQQAYRKGYALRLELGTGDDEIVPGKIFMAMPDDDHSVVAGMFVATIRDVTPPARVMRGGAFDSE